MIEKDKNGFICRPKDLAVYNITDVFRTLTGFPITSLIWSGSGSSCRCATLTNLGRYGGPAWPVYLQLPLVGYQNMYQL